MEITKVQASWDGGASSQHMAQYTSLVLIILTFVVGALSRPYEGGATQNVPPSLEANVTELRRINRLKFNIFGLNSSEEFRTDEIDALYFVLSNHDLNAEIDVYGDSAIDPENSGSELDSNITLAVARAMTLLRHLVRMGLDPSTLRVRAKDGFESSQVIVRLVDISGKS